MLQIRDDHMQGFQDVARDNFEERGVRHLRECLPGQTGAFSDDQLRIRVRDCIARANNYGLTTERQVMSFTDATFLSGEHFDTDRKCRWASALLNDRRLDADTKALWLLSFAGGRA